ncbi:MAG: phosphoadenylyl-sulfate reductase [Proteobacteria bacterium]|nr:phosphoadenylyl-sulfate reductase [Pseudomonadota bacterium]
MTAEDRVASALRTLPGQHIVSSSFGAQSAVMLHLVTRQKPDISVVLIDTGYLFPETYRFIDELTDRLALNLKVFQPEISNAWQEARYGKRWEQDLRGLEDYNQNNKVEPMQRAIEELNVGTWFSGLRRNQSIDRAKIPFIESSGDRFKVYPIADWTDKDVFNYLQEHKLPYHPLWEKGYVSIGDVHTTKSLAEVDSIEETRFFGLKRECGLHELDFGKSIAEVKSA